MKKSIKHSKSKRKPSKQTSSNNPAILQAALDYIKRGWRVFPCYAVKADRSCTCNDPKCKDIGKHPYSPLVPNGFKNASNDPATIMKWFGPDSPLLNLALATGKDSRVTVIDVDMGKDKEGNDKVGDVTWAALIEGHGEPPTVKAATGGGGVHLFFDYNMHLQNGNDRLGKHVDVKNDGGYVLVAPSNHKSGGTYRWDGEWNVPLWALPDYLQEKKDEKSAKRGPGRPKKDDVSRQTFTLSEVERMLAVIPADDQDLWVKVGLILGREFHHSEAAWEVYRAWSDKWDGPRDAAREKRMRHCFYKGEKLNGSVVTLGTIVKLALENGWAPKTGDVPIEDLLYVVDANEYLDRHTGKYWITAAVDAAVSPVNVDGKIVKASDWLKQHKLVTSLARDPNMKGDYLVGFDCLDGVLVPGQGRACVNQYRWPTIDLGDAALATPYVDHVRLLLNKPGDADQFLDYMAFLVQRPGVKLRFALLLAGTQGNGKDTALSFVYPAIGHWNVYPIDPKVLEGGFNEHEAATLVVINECANPQEMSKWAFNEKTKVLIAGNPDHTTINPKYGVKYTCRRFCGTVLTTNNLASGIYIPQDDRRYDVMETATFAEMKLEDEKVRRQYFETLYGWFYAGGDRHIAAFLHQRDLSKFSPDHGQRKTAAHQSVVAANLESDAWLLDILSVLGDPALVRADWIETKAVGVGELHEYKPMEVRRKLLPTMERAGYGKYRNPKKPDGRWYPERNKGVVVYIKIGIAAPTAEELNLLLLQKTGF